MPEDHGAALGSGVSQGKVIVMQVLGVEIELVVTTKHGHGGDNITIIYLGLR